MPGGLARLAPAAAAATVLAFGSTGAARAAGGGVGYDASYPQCGKSLPGGGAFAVVGVDAGKPFGANPCLAAQLAWGGAGAQLYANTANPGPGASAHWPSGQTSPQPCPATASNTPACAYDYGWNAAEDSYADAVDGYVAAGLAPAGSTRTPAANAWWLDVEAANSWEQDAPNNAAALQGAVDYLRSVAVAAVGVYATPADWLAITDGSTRFAALPFWLPGATTLADAQSRCSQTAPTGAQVALVQFPQGDVDCAQVPALALAAASPGGPLVARLPAPAAAPVTVTLSSSSATGRFAEGAAGPWTPTASVVVPAGATQAPPVLYRDDVAGTPALTARADGYAAAALRETVKAPACSARHRGGFEIVVARRPTKAAATAVARRTRLTASGRRVHPLVERAGCSGYRVAIRGFATRAAARRTLRSLRPRVRGAVVARG